MSIKVIRKVVKKVEAKKKKKMTRRMLIQEKIAWFESIPNKNELQELELAQLKQDLKVSKRASGARNKGANYERTIAKKFKDRYSIELVRTPLSGGFAKQSETADNFRGDITVVDKDLNFRLHIECKDCKTWSLKSWIAQAKADCPSNRIPIVVMHQGREIEEGKISQENDDYVVLKVEDFFKLTHREDIISLKEKR